MSPTEELGQDPSGNGKGGALDGLTVDDSGNDKNEPGSNEEKLFLGKFKTEQEAADYVANLEGKANEKEEKASLKRILDLRRGDNPPPVNVPAAAAAAPAAAAAATATDQNESGPSVDTLRQIMREEINSAVNPLKEKVEGQSDVADAQEIMQYPNFENYLDAAHLEVKRYPGQSLLKAFKSVYDMKEFMKPENQKKVVQQQETPEERNERKRVAQVETTQSLPGEELADKNEKDQLKQHLGYNQGAPGRQA